MKKVFIAIFLLTASMAANAIEVVLIQHNSTSSTGGVSTYITDGSHLSGIAAPSDAIWDWDGSILSSVGFYGATLSIGSVISTNTIISDQFTDLSIDTATLTTSGTSYTCVEGTFLFLVGFNGCGGYTLGINNIDESTTVWSGTSVSQTLGGDDVTSGTGPRLISAYNFGLITFTGDGLTPGDTLIIGSGNIGVPGTETMTFQVVPIPAAAWLFGSALGLLGWMRRKRS